MKSSLSFLLLVSFSALAQQRPDECPRPGLLLNTENLGVTGERKALNLDRSGTPDLNPTAAFNGTIVARTFKNYRDTICVSREYQQDVFQEINPDLALGRGNQLLASLFDPRVSTLQRAAQFEANVRYMAGEYRPGVRLESAIQIVDQLSKYVAVAGLPRSWDDFRALMNKGVAEGLLMPQIVADIIDVNQIINMRILGFERMPGAIITEGNGNGSLDPIFDIKLSPDVRANHINRLLVGIGPKDAQALSRSFIEFAFSRGMPQTWNQFVIMMKDSLDKGAINVRDFEKVTIERELENRRRLGFDLTARIRVIQTFQYNARETRARQEFFQNVSKNFSINITEAPLVGSALKAEVERFNLSFDGMGPIQLSLPQEFNAYRLTSQTEDAGTVTIQVKGQRKAANPPAESLHIQFNRVSKDLFFKFQNKNFNPATGGKMVIRVSFWNAKFGKDKKLGEETYVIENGDLTSITAALKNHEVDFAKIAWKIEGSQYYNANFLPERKVKP